MSKTVKEVLAGLAAKKGKKSSQKKGGDKKHGRNKAKCALYRAQGRRDKNKARKQRKIAKMLEKKRRAI